MDPSLGGNVRTFDLEKATTQNNVVTLPMTADEIAKAPDKGDA